MSEFSLSTKEDALINRARLIRLKAAMPAERAWTAFFLRATMADRRDFEIMACETATGKHFSPDTNHAARAFYGTNIISIKKATQA